MVINLNKTKEIVFRRPSISLHLLAPAPSCQWCWAGYVC